MKEDKNTNKKKVEDTEKKSFFISEFSKKRRNLVFIGVGIYILSFFVLALIGDSINENPYTFFSFLSPVLYLSGIIMILLFLTRKKFLKDNLDNN